VYYSPFFPPNKSDGSTEKTAKRKKIITKIENSLVAEYLPSSQKGCHRDRHFFITKTKNKRFSFRCKMTKKLKIKNNTK